MIPYTNRPSAPVSARATSFDSCRDSNRGVGDPSTSRTKRRSKEAIDGFIFGKILVSLTWADEAVERWATERLRCYTSDQGYLHPLVRSYQPLGTCGVDPGKLMVFAQGIRTGRRRGREENGVGPWADVLFINTALRSKFSKLD